MLIEAVLISNTPVTTRLSVVSSFATVDLHLQVVSIKANEVRKTEENACRKYQYVYYFGVHTSTLVLL
jgi:hypothetical protein